MANNLPSLLTFLILLTFHEMMIMRGEATECDADSRIYKGSCFRSKNCGSICETEGFISGKCHKLMMQCVCFKDCGKPGISPAHGHGPPLDMPVQEGPVNEQPGAGSGGGGLPSEEQPGEGPASEE
ncbi:hypothetical protein CASFOL_040550 [Castilleja foliolosa]|uniref:Knottins-like domain-containing protein n=1 Tax=Castilleja foliolosa TaxID=1961234 RepID=A0ABD3BC97_9LAMI